MPEDPLRFEPQLITSQDEKQRFMSTTLLIEGARKGNSF
jgi:hypothetical protein